MSMAVVVMFATFHHPHHFGATGLEENNRQYCEDDATISFNYTTILNIIFGVNHSSVMFARNPAR